MNYLRTRIIFYLILLITFNFLISCAHFSEPIPDDWEIKWSENSVTTSVVIKGVYRPTITTPTRYRLIVIPGSGCGIWGHQLHHLFRHALHAEVLLLQKPWSYPTRSGHGACDHNALIQDDLRDWREHLVRTISKDANENPSFWNALPVFLVALSEGAELVPSLFQVLPRVDTVILVSASGLDPVTVGAAQAKRLGHEDIWNQVAAHVENSKIEDTQIFQGRSIRYWRSMFVWSVAAQWSHSPWPVLRIWGDKDTLIPIEMYQEGTELFEQSGIKWCDRKLSQADHHLQAPERDGFQWLWGQVEQSVRHHTMRPINLCAQILPLSP